MVGLFLLVGNVVICVAAIVLAALGLIPWVLAAPVSLWMAGMAFMVGNELWEDWV